MGNAGVPGDSVIWAQRRILVPLYGQSKASHGQLITSALGMSMTTCNTFYDNYFKLNSIEVGALEADPDVEFSGFCAEGFISFVQVMVMFQGFLSMVMVFVTAPHFLVSADQVKGTEHLSQVLPCSEKHHGA